ncbi:MAG: hypothetical protein COU46_00195 [Candidatus Niyogibacteria bacterium CG10_big_fil_rev_8_21_14_0_10_42_19]|uniref:Uncharacterized protein n=1 Tax=Candidatus Niyogibacteria bacterium CG10_big_fil_rev_8_21_14_0_10_42_19 TaxID=1974725 RepID=A0A2H0TGL6_9BACT|nr:MAG: hypothetical protein COU46_00195 [Candidatus Niyogibacteria bacterium CG10_big_fil_rev_8_21_14_0_10_42_19]
MVLAPFKKDILSSTLNELKHIDRQISIFFPINLADELKFKRITRKQKGAARAVPDYFNSLR